MNVAAYARDLAAEAGIPAELVGSVMARYYAAHGAIETMRRWRDGRDRAGPPVRVLVERIVERAASDYRIGVLERRCE